MLNKSATKRKLTRREQRDLDLEIAFMEGLVQRDGAYVEAWKVLSEAYSRRSRFLDGLQVDEKLAQLQPESPEVLYNLACSYSLTKNIERAVETLTRAIGRGFNDFKWMLRDPDLVQLRKDPIFKKVWVTISALQAGVL
jgi:tetratricopeptide (TPR) repeat protein